MPQYRNLDEVEQSSWQCSPALKRSCILRRRFIQAKAYGNSRHREFSWAKGGRDAKCHLERADSDFSRCPYGEQRSTNLEYTRTLIDDPCIGETTLEDISIYALIGLRVMLTSNPSSPAATITSYATLKFVSLATSPSSKLASLFVTVSRRICAWPSSG